MEQKVYIKNSAGENLCGVFQKVNDKKTVVVVAHGFTSNKERNFKRPLCVALNKAGVNAFRFDFAGHGESEGKFSDATYTKEIADLRSVVDHFSRLGFSVGCAGHSQGGAVVILEAAADARVRFVVSIAGVTETPRFFERFCRKRYVEGEEAVRKSLAEKGYYEFVKRDETFRMDKDFFTDIVKYDIEGSVSKIGVPKMFVVGSSDGERFVLGAKNLHRLAPGSKLVIVKGADHSFTDPALQSEMIKKVVRWVKETGF